jgi:hypothetical protein
MQREKKDNTNTMTKKDFIALADVLRNTKPDSPAYSEGYMVWTAVRDLIADTCARDNPQFNRSRWLGYIAGTNGPSGGTVKGGAR